MTDGYTGTVKGIADRRGWCDIRPGPKAEEARDMWRRARRSKLRVEMAIKLGTETRIATIVSCRRLPKGGVRLRFEADPMTVAVTSGEQLEQLMGKGAMGSKHREMP
jgi:hypothetical protein